MSLTELIDFLRTRGITRYRTPELELDLGAVPEKEDPEVDNPAKLVKGKLGKDGLTAAQQLENYGVVYDAED
jgi:hypothetical protein